MTGQNQVNSERDNRRFRLGVSDFSTAEPLANAELIVASGMDFIEPGLAKIAAMSEQEFAAAATRIKNQNIRVLSTNWFLPSELKVTGPNVDLEKLHQFLDRAIGRAANLGATAIVFGSPGSRAVPDGFDENLARQQMIEFCQLGSDVIRCNEWDLKIAVEHVNHTETNFVNTFAQAMSIVREVDRPEIGLAADFYHFMMENESLDIMQDAGDSICAVQLADPDGRQFPKPGAEIPELDSFLRILVDIGYSGECPWRQLLARICSRIVGMLWPDLSLALVDLCGKLQTHAATPPESLHQLRGGDLRFVHSKQFKTGRNRSPKGHLNFSRTMNKHAI